MFQVHIISCGMMTRLSVYKNNEASLKVQLKCGAYKVGETEEDYLMRIKIDKK